MAALAGDAVKSVEQLLSEKEAIVGKERKLIEGLNTALARMGYRIVPVTAPVVRRRGRPPKNQVLPVTLAAPRPRGRPPMTAAALATAPKRRGRPRKAK